MPPAKKKNTSAGRSTLKGDISKMYRLMLDKKLSELSIEEEGSVSLTLKRKGSEVQILQGAVAAAPEPEKQKFFIRSPMNGVFYRSASPTAEAYVNEGDEIFPGSTVCLIEAMKLMNEVQVETRCRILKVIAENASAVRTNDPLFEIESL